MTRMVTYIRFRLRKPLRQLLSKGVVATIRGCKWYREGRVVEVLDRGYRKVCEACITRVEPFSEDGVRKWWVVSGFESPREWLESARRMYRSLDGKCIVVLVVRGHEG